MTLNTSEVLDLSKENVQPLRQGRKAAHLKTALQAQTDPETQHRLQKQREKYEYMIRMYEGDDPLEPYWNYVAWLEQSFTKLNRESNLIPVLEDAINKFRDTDKYKQDPRFVQLMIKYISMQSNALELYQLVYNQGLGTMCSSLYKAWAEELDKCNDFKRADQIYQLGLHCRAQPTHELQDAHIQFQLSIARRMLEGNIINNDTGTENTRTALSKLQPSKVKSSRISKDTAGVFQLTTNNSDHKTNSVSVGKFKIYQEDECDGLTRSEHKMKNEKLPRASISERENTMKPSKWCGQKQKQSAAFRSSMPTTPSFQIHEDPDAGCENLKTTIRPRALKIRKEEFRCPVAVFEDPDPTKKPMYPKHLVYVGGRDIQLEELRAAMYWKRIEKKEQEKHNELQESKESCNVSIAEVKNSNNLPIEHSNKKLETKTELHSIPETPKKNESADVEALVGLSVKGGAPPLASPSQSFTINTKVALNVINSMWGSPFPASNEKRKEAKIATDFTQKENAKPELLAFPVFCDDADEPVIVPTSEFKKPKSPFPVFCDDDQRPIIPCSEPKNKFSSSLDAHQPPVPSTEPKKKIAFPVFCDDAPPAADANKFSFPVFCDEMLATSTQKNDAQPVFQPENKFTFSAFADDGVMPLVDEPKNNFPDINKLLFPVNSDDDIPSLGKNFENRTPVQTDKYSIPLIIPVNLADTPLEPENKENCPPKSYATPIERRPLSGILTPATDVPFKELNDEDSEDDDDYCRGVNGKTNDFDEETCSTKAFAIMLPSSTPCSRPSHTVSARKSLL